MHDIGSMPDDVELADLRAPGVKRRAGGPWSPSTIPPLPPVAPQLLVPRAPRPIIAADALTLAEQALERGDALDAAAQLRPLLSSARPEARPYLEIQLSQAYVALGRLDEAETILRRAVARGTAHSWPAVFELATLLVRDRGADPVATWQELAPRVDPLRTDLGRHLLQFTTSEEAVAALSTYAPPSPTSSLAAHTYVAAMFPPATCLDELAAFEATPPDKLPSWRFCPVQISRRGTTRRSLAAQDQLLAIARVTNKWRFVMESNFPDEERWLQEAHRLADVVAMAPDEPGARIASWLAMLAYQNAARFAANRGEKWTVTREYAEYARKHVERMHPEFRDHIIRIADSFMQVGR